MTFDVTKTKTCRHARKNFWQKVWRQMLPVTLQNTFPEAWLWHINLTQCYVGIGFHLESLNKVLFEHWKKLLEQSCCLLSMIFDLGYIAFSECVKICLHNCYKFLKTTVCIEFARISLENFNFKVFLLMVEGAKMPNNTTVSLHFHELANSFSENLSVKQSSLGSSLQTFYLYEFLVSSIWDQLRIQLF